MAQGSRLHLSYERMALLISGCPAYQGTSTVSPLCLQRVQDINYSFNYNAQQVREIGSFEYIKDRNALNSRIPIISQPSVTLNFSYFLYDAFNESQMGFNIGSEGIFGGTSTLYKFPDFTNDPGAIAQKGDVNFFVLAEPSSWRKDIVGRKEAFPFQGLDLIGLGNCYLTSYNLSASIGSLVSCSVSYQCSNISFDIYDHAAPPTSPAVSVTGSRSNGIVDLPEDQIKDQVEHPNSEKSILVLRPGDLEVTLKNNKPNSEGGFNLIDLNTKGMAIQSVDISMNIDRQDINGLGSNYIKDRKMQFPILCGLSFSVIARNFEDKVDIEKIFRDDVDFDVELMMYIRDTLTEKRPKLRIKIESAKLNSEAHAVSVGGCSCCKCRRILSD